MSAKRKQTESPEPEKRPERERMSFYISTELGESLRDAVAALPHLTLAGIAEDALQAQLAKLQRAHNGGKPFPPRVRALKPGRRVR